jgi:hypothetical protein
MSQRVSAAACALKNVESAEETERLGHSSVVPSQLQAAAVALACNCKTKLEQSDASRRNPHSSAEA